jgi:type IV pilus assembly protein PilW
MTRSPSTSTAARGQGGFSLTELMISLLLGTLMIAGALTIFLHSRIAWQSVENIAGLEERLAYALHEIEQDVRHAGYWGQHASSELIAGSGEVPVRCNGNRIDAWALDLSVAIAATDGLFDLPCPPHSSHVANSDTLTLRFAQSDFALPDEEFIRLASSPSAGRIVDVGEPVGSGELLFNLAVRGWYLDGKSSEHGLYGLRRYTLVKGGLLQNQEIIPGIEDFQVSLGVDRDADGLIDGFVDADKTDSASTVLAVRIWLLARTPAPEPGHVDSGSWQSIDDETTPLPRPPDSFRRQSAERTIWLRNQPEAY